jgi:hypothetical protein
MRRGQATVNRDCLAVDIRRRVTQQETRHFRDLDRFPVPHAGINLSNAVLCTLFSCPAEYGRGHTGGNEPRTYGIDSDPGTVKLVRDSLYHTDNGGLAGAVVHASRIGAKSRHACSTHNRTMALFPESLCRMLDTIERANSIDAQRSLPVITSQFIERPVGATDAGICIEPVGTAELLRARVEQ